MYYPCAFSVYSGHGEFIYRNMLVWVHPGEALDTAIRRNYNLKKILFTGVPVN